jgi:hypothetical protein
MAGPALDADCSWVQRCHLCSFPEATAAQNSACRMERSTEKSQGSGAGTWPARLTQRDGYLRLSTHLCVMENKEGERTVGDGEEREERKKAQNRR